MTRQLQRTAQSWENEMNESRNEEQKEGDTRVQHTQRTHRREAEEREERRALTAGVSWLHQRANLKRRKESVERVMRV